MAKKKMYSVGCRIYYLTDEQVEFGKALLEQLRHKVSIKLEPAEIFGFTEDEEEDSQSSFFLFFEPPAHYPRVRYFGLSRGFRKIFSNFILRKVVDKIPKWSYNKVYQLRGG